MGQKQSRTANHWTIDDWAFGTGPNAVHLEDVFQEAKTVPTRFFGGETIENDPSMHRLQEELLLFDRFLRKLFRRKKSSKRMMEVEEEDEETTDHYYYYLDGVYEDRAPYSPIPEEDETNLSSPYVNVKPIDQGLHSGARWRCRYCTAENKATDIDCHECKQTETRF